MRMPQISSGAPNDELEPCGKYSAPSGPKFGWLVMWSRIDRGSPVITSPASSRFGPARRVILPLKSGALLKVKALLLAQTIGYAGVDAGSKAKPVVSRGPLFSLCSDVRMVGLPSVP